MHFKIATAIAIAFFVWVRPVAAQEIKTSSPKLGTERPWAMDEGGKEIPLERQKAALALFREGNTLFKEDSAFVPAAAKYREALGHWNHPAIHYNLALTLFYLGQLRDARRHLLKAIGFGPEPLDAGMFEKAKALIAQAERQLAQVDLSCQEPDAKVVMDGTTLFVGPGNWTDYVPPGPHTIVATKEGYLTNQISRTLGSGDRVAFDIRLFKTSDLTVYRRRWKTSTPWTVVASGLAAGLVGGGLHYAANKSFGSYDKAVEDKQGSAPDSEIVAKRTRGEILQGFAIGLYAAGGAALVTGAVLVYMNRLQPYQEMPPADALTPRAPMALSWSIAPMLGEMRGVQATIRF